MANEAQILKPYKVERHPAADKLDIVTFGSEGGWVCVCGRDQFTLDSLIVYIEPGSVIPDNIVEHLRKTAKIKIENRIRSIKLRGIISEGLCLTPLDFLPPGAIKENADVSELLGVIHYEPPEPQYSWANNTTKGRNKIYHNEYFKKYVHIDRFQKHSKILTKDDDVCVTLKYHGMNSRAAIVRKPLKLRQSKWHRFKRKFLSWLVKTEDMEYLVGSHNTIRVVGKWGVNKDDHFLRAADRYDLKNVIQRMQSYLKDLARNNKPDTIIFYEVIGWQTKSSPVQEGYEYGLEPGEIDIRVFDIMCDGKYLDWNTVVSLCRATKLPLVKELYRGKFNLDLLKLAEATDTYNDKEYVREGVVIKPLVEKRDMGLGRVILKEINKEYQLLKEQTDHH